MNISCIICTDFLLPTAELFITPCGHIFHHACLLNWIQRSKTCPQCRQKTTEKSIHRVYLNVTTPTTLDESPAVLLNKLNTIETHLQKVKEKNSVLKNQNLLLRIEIKSLEDKDKGNESSMLALKQQIHYYKTQAKKLEKVEDELLSLKERILLAKDVETIIAGSRDQVNDMLKHNRDPNSLHILIATLKKELMDSEKRKKTAVASMKEARSESDSYKKMLAQLQLKNKTYKQQLENLKGTESERLYLKKQLKDLKENRAANGDEQHHDLTRAIRESPAPLSRIKRKLNADDGSLIDLSTPSPATRIKRIMDSDSPYLPIKSSNIVTGLYNKPTNIGHSETSALESHLMRRQLEINAGRRASTNENSFDGLGGHSREDVYPTSKVIHKKPKSNSSVASIKFKKLAPCSSVKLNNYFKPIDKVDD